MSSKERRTVMIRAMRRVQSFGDLSTRDLSEVIDQLQPREFAQGQVVVAGREDDEPALYLVQEGQLQELIEQPELGWSHEVRRLGPGDVFGETQVITGQSSHTTVRAVTPVRLLVLSREELLRAVERSTGLSWALCLGLARQLAMLRGETAAPPFVNLDDYPLKADLAGLIPLNVIALCRAVPIDAHGDRLTVAMVDPFDERALRFLSSVLRPYQVEPVGVSEAAFERFQSRQGSERVRIQELELPESPLHYRTTQGVREPVGGQSFANLLERALKEALLYGASDVHLVPWGLEARVRLRIEGRLFDSRVEPTRQQLVHMINRLKVMAELDISSRRKPQSGSLTLDLDDRQVELRTSTTPCRGGKKAAVRVLDPVRIRRELGGLFALPTVAVMVRELFMRPSGLLLVTGPAGSGKTTTLYAGLSEIWADDHGLNLVTIEDPVEYRLDFATQISVDPRYEMDFTSVLRNVLRQDPDVILVGEIRDRESARVAVEAATTGHLVLSSLHTHFSLEALARLRQLAVPPYLIADALSGVVSQRLMARVCPACRELLVAPEPLLAQLVERGITTPEAGLQLYRSPGCVSCALGAGRLALFEVLLIDPTLRRRIDERAHLAEVQGSLGPRNFLSMQRYACELLRQGLIDAVDVLRAFPRGDFEARLEDF